MYYIVHHMVNVNALKYVHIALKALSKVLLNRLSRILNSQGVILNNESNQGFSSSKGPKYILKYHIIILNIILPSRHIQIWCVKTRCDK